MSNERARKLRPWRCRKRSAPRGKHIKRGRESWNLCLFLLPKMCIEWGQQQQPQSEWKLPIWSSLLEIQIAQSSWILICNLMRYLYYYSQQMNTFVKQSHNSRSKGFILICTRNKLHQCNLLPKSNSDNAVVDNWSKTIRHSNKGTDQKYFRYRIQGSLATIWLTKKQKVNACPYQLSFNKIPNINPVHYLSHNVHLMLV